MHGFKNCAVIKRQLLQKRFVCAQPVNAPCIAARLCLGVFRHVDVIGYTNDALTRIARDS